VQFSVLTIAFTIGLSAVIATAFRVNIADSWDEKRCDPYVVPIASFFKPSADPRTPSEFATDNWKFCQKQFVQRAISTAAEAPKALANSAAATVGMMQNVASTVGDIFYNVWRMCFQTYSMFMTKMKEVAKLFQNFMINLYSIVERLNASAVSIIFGLIALIVTIINSIQVTLIVAIIVIGIIIVLQIVLFFFLLPISGLIITVTALVSVVVVTVATAIAAAMVSEMFSPGACFAADTPVQLKNGKLLPISEIKIGDILRDGGRVIATHLFHSRDSFYNLHGIRVTGDHLIADPENSARRIRVSDHPAAVEEKWCMIRNTDMWCLTTTTRRIPCMGNTGILLFADWEEIADGDIPALMHWYRLVWHSLNKGTTAPRPSDAALEAEAGLSPDCQIACKDWMGRRSIKRMSDVRVGDYVCDGPTTTTRVIGKVVIAGDQSTDAVEVEGQFVSCATWIHGSSGWTHAEGVIHEVHPVWWEHLYTESGKFMLATGCTPASKEAIATKEATGCIPASKEATGCIPASKEATGCIPASEEATGILVRDASDVGLSNLRSLVDSVVLDRF